MIASAELAMQRQLTQAFIDADWLTIVLLRSAWTSDGAGGRLKGVEVSLAPQTFRLIPQDDGTTERLTADGKAVNPTYRLLGPYTADMQRWDEFVIDGKRYQIVFINANRQYEVKGGVAYLG